MKKIYLFFASLFLTLAGDTQQADSCSTRISLLTCTPGDELYSTFGHSALRVVDESNSTDLVFNYGTFDFYDPQFYQKFTSGRLLYFVSVSSLPEFLYEYQYFKRGVTEQVLNLSCDEKQRFIAALHENAKEENKYYRYDFNYDNCTTRLRDMLEKITGQTIETINLLPGANTTFRNLIHDYLDKNGQHWSKLGIDILLGSPLDKKITNREAMFLPDYLMLAFDGATMKGKKLVLEKNSLLPETMARNKKSWLTPFVVFGALFLLILVLGMFSSKATFIFFRIFDFIFFLVCGLLGVLLLYMWFGTLHAMADNNFNLLWALPTHAIAACFIFSKKQWVGHYFRFMSFYNAALMATWFFLPQQMNAALLPVVGIIAVRSFFISKRNNVE